MNKWIIPQDWNAYGPAEHTMWDTLFARQVALLSNRAAPAFLEGLDVLRMSKPGIPDFTELSQRLQKATGWSVVAVPGLIPDEDFFENLANRRFVATRAGAMAILMITAGFFADDPSLHDGIA